MINKTQSYILAAIMTLVAGIGILSTGLVAFAGVEEDHNDNRYSNYRPYSSGGGSNENVNENVNSNNINLGPQVAQIPSYQYSQPYAPTYQQIPMPPPAPAPDYYYQAPPGIPNAGIGDIGYLNLALLFLSGLFVAAGLAYLLPWSKPKEKLS
jgi:hypothetical protein